MFKNGTIDGVSVKDLVRHNDERGWLTEIFRSDEIDAQFMPAMGYISLTKEGGARGPHEHVDQADFFCFLGPSTFKIFLWDNRKNSSTYMSKQTILAGEEAPKSVIIPAGIVHAYKNVGREMGMVVNCPNRLFAGRGKKEPVDEIRHEKDPNTMYTMD